MRDYAGHWHPADKYETDAMKVQFYTEATEDEEAMDKALAEDGDDRIIWKDAAFARLQSPADPKSKWDYDVEKFDRQAIQRGKPHEQLKVRFRTAWEAFERGAKDEIVGTPLSEWPEMTRAMVKNLNQLGFLSVEDVAAVHDDHLAQLGQHGRKVRDRARVFLEPRDKAQATMQTKIDQQANEIENLKAMIEQMKNMPAVPQADGAEAAPKRRGRPPKVAEAA
jgi:hypothetical protein